MKTLIFLDDEREYKDVYWIKYPEYEQIFHVKTESEFMQVLVTLCKNSEDYEVSFDHDLQLFVDNKETTGYNILKSND